MPTAIIIDDEQSAIEVLTKRLFSIDEDIRLLASFTDSVEALKNIRELEPDIIFLDIKMPSINGFDLLAILGPIKSHIIFVTAFAEYAVRAFKFSAIDFVLKPVSFDDIKIAVDKAKQQIEYQLSHEQLSTLKEHIRNDDKINDSVSQELRIGIPDTTEEKGRRQNVIRFKKIKDVIYLKAQGRKTNIFCESENGFISSTKSIGDFEELLSNYCFYKINRSDIINLKKIKDYKKGDGKIYMDNDLLKPINLPGQRRDEFIDACKKCNVIFIDK